MCHHKSDKMKKKKNETHSKSKIFTKIFTNTNKYQQINREQILPGNKAASTAISASQRQPSDRRITNDRACNNIQYTDKADRTQLYHIAMRLLVYSLFVLHLLPSFITGIELVIVHCSTAWRGATEYRTSIAAGRHEAATRWCPEEMMFSSKTSHNRTTPSCSHPQTRPATYTT